MTFLINPNIAYLLIVTAVMLFMMTAVAPKSNLLKVGIALFLGAAGYEFSQIGGNPWAILVVAVSPLPFFMAIRKPHSQPVLVIVTIVMLTIGPVFIFWDANGQLYSLPIAGFVAIICGRIIWILFLRIRDTRSTRLSDNPDSLVGVIGTASTAIEKYDRGSVNVEGELWEAHSDQPISAGSMVRIVSFNGLSLKVEKVEKLTRSQNSPIVRSQMPFEQHQEKNYPKEPQSIYQAALKAAEKLEGKVISSSPDNFRFEAKFPKVILGKTLGERTQLSCEVRSQGESCLVVVDAFPLDALERKLLFGARKGVTLTVVTWFTAHLEHNLGIPPA